MDFRLKHCTSLSPINFSGFSAQYFLQQHRLHRFVLAVLFTVSNSVRLGGTFISPPISPKRVEVRCSHVSTSERVFNVDSVTLRSRLSRPCENPECRYKSGQKEAEYAHEKSSGRKQRSQRGWTLQERALERERELLRQERLRLEEERRRLEYDRRKFVDAGRCNDRRYRFSPVSHVGRRLVFQCLIFFHAIKSFGTNIPWQLGDP